MAKLGSILEFSNAENLERWSNSPPTAGWFFETFSLFDTVDIGGTGLQNLGKHATVILERFLTRKVYQTYQTREALEQKSMSQKVENFQKGGGGVSAKNQNVHNSKCRLWHEGEVQIFRIDFDDMYG